MTKQNRRDFINLLALSAGFLGLSTNKAFAKEDIQGKIEDLANAPKAAISSVIELLLPKESYKIIGQAGGVEKEVSSDVYEMETIDFFK
jgi:hypothetical protein